MMKLTTSTCLVLATLVSGADATPKPAAAKFVVNEWYGKTAVRVGEVVRAADGTVTLTAVPAPTLDAITKQFVADWNAHKQPASVTITDHIASDTGMNPAVEPHTFTFTAKDKLYKAAVIRDFLAKRGYVAKLGMTTLRFVEFDSSAEWPPTAHDRASTRSNFRKGETIDFNGGEKTFWIGKQQHAYRSPGPGRKSASDPKTIVANGYHDGALEVARMRLFEDGRIEIVPVFAKDRFETQFGRFTAEDTKVRVYVNGDWNDFTVAKDSPKLLEAQLLEREHYQPYQIVPTIDPAKLR
jgi:hypothetical protein